MKKILMISMMLLVGQSTFAENYILDEGVYKLAPTEEPYVTTCKHYQMLNNEESKIIFIKNTVTDLNTKMEKSMWQRFVCPSDCDKKISSMVFTPAKEGLSAGYTFDVTFVSEGRFFEVPEFNSLIEKYRTECKKGFTQADNRAYRAIFSGEEQKCVKNKYLEELNSRWDIGPSSRKLFGDNAKKSFLDFYQVCHQELVKSYIKKKAADSVTVLKRKLEGLHQGGQR